MQGLTWIFLDLGWTLVDETSAHRVRLARIRGILSRLGCDHSVDELMVMCTRAATDFAPSPYLGMLEALGLSAADLESVKAFVPYPKEHEVLYPGVPQLLESLAQGYHLGVIANQSAGTERRLEKWGIRQHFSVIFASAELGLSKPDPRVFAQALVLTDSPPEEVVMVGDRLDNDIGPAKSRGWKTIRVLQGFSREQEAREERESPHVTIESIHQLQEVLPER